MVLNKKVRKLDRQMAIIEQRIGDLVCTTERRKAYLKRNPNGLHAAWAREDMHEFDERIAELVIDHEKLFKRRRTIAAALAKLPQGFYANI